MAYDPNEMRRLENEMRRLEMEWEEAMRRGDKRRAERLEEMARYLDRGQIGSLLPSQGLNAWAAMPMLPVEPPRSPLDPDKLAALKEAEPRKVGQRVPDSINPVIGWRGWKSVNVDGKWMLSALGSTGNWTPKAPIEAKCNKDAARHPAPHNSCECGIWAFPSLGSLEKALTGYQTNVIGEVYLWGRIIECTNGFRAQFAYPKELWLLDNTLEELGYIYNVPIRTI